MNELNGESRAKVLKTILIEKYPNGEIKAIPVGMENIKQIIFDPGTIEDKLKELKVDKAVWNTGKWEDNPAILIERTDGYVILYSKYSGHAHIPDKCYPAGLIVYPLGSPESLPGATILHV